MGSIKKMVMPFYYCESLLNSWIHVVGTHMDNLPPNMTLAPSTAFFYALYLGIISLSLEFVPVALHTSFLGRTFTVRFNDGLPGLFFIQCTYRSSSSHCYESSPSILQDPKATDLQFFREDVHPTEI